MQRNRVPCKNIYVSNFQNFQKKPTNRFEFQEIWKDLFQISRNLKRGVLSNVWKFETLCFEFVKTWQRLIIPHNHLCFNSKFWTCCNYLWKFVSIFESLKLFFGFLFKTVSNFRKLKRNHQIGFKFLKMWKHFLQKPNCFQFEKTNLKQFGFSKTVSKFWQVEIVVLRNLKIFNFQNVQNWKGFLKAVSTFQKVQWQTWRNMWSHWFSLSFWPCTRMGRNWCLV